MSLHLRSAILPLVSLMALTACAEIDARPGLPSPLDGVTTLARADGTRAGSAELRAVDGGLAIKLEASGMAPGNYGVHVHAVGRCDGPDFTTAGPHWNPAMRQHGLKNPAGTHAGDLPNLTIGADGRGRLEGLLRGAALAGETGLFDRDGAALMIHAAPDDMRTDPSGNSGARIACGVFVRR